MQQNNLLTEISALIIAALLVIAGAVLLFFGKIGYDNAVFFFITALGLFGYNSAIKAPSQAQQASLTQLASNQQQLLAQVVSQQSQPVQAPAPPAPTPAPVSLTAPQNLTAALPFNYSQLPSASIAIPPAGTMPQAIQTTGIVPTVKP